MGLTLQQLQTMGAKPGVSVGTDNTPAPSGHSFQELQAMGAKPGVSLDNTSKDAPLAQSAPDSMLGKALTGIGNFAKSVTSPVATMLARPIQAGAELLGASPDSVDKATKNLTGDWVAPVPRNFSDVKKDVGRGAETIALGLNPVAGGGLYGAGNSVEQGNDILSVPTATSGLLGAVGGKALSVASPYLGKAVNAIVPKFAKDAGGKVGELIKPLIDRGERFMEKTKILPDAASKVVNKAADVINDAPSKAWGVIKGQYGGTGGGNSAEALKSQAMSEVSKALGETGKKSAGVYIKADPNKLKGLENMYDNAPSVKLSDGTLYDPTTANLHQNVDALAQLKKKAYNEYTNEVKKATGAGVQIDTIPTETALQDILNSPGKVRMHGQATKILSEIRALKNNPEQLQSYIETLNNGLKGVFTGGAASIERDVDAIAVRQLNDALDNSVVDLGEKTSPIRKAKNEYSSYKSIEDGLVKKAQAAARKAEGPYGSGLYDYINPFNIADALEMFSNPVSGVKAGLRMVLNKAAKTSKDPENILRGIFDKIRAYKDLQQGIKPTGLLSDVLKNAAVGGVIKSTNQ